MASLIMTIDSSDDETTQKLPQDTEDLMIENDKKKQEYFLVSDDDESENEHVQRLEDGSKANVWSFNTQMKTDTK
jgi:hypothetical protein